MADSVPSPKLPDVVGSNKEPDVVVSTVSESTSSSRAGSETGHQTLSPNETADGDHKATTIGDAGTSDADGKAEALKSDGGDTNQEASISNEADEKQETHSSGDARESSESSEIKSTGNATELQTRIELLETALNRVHRVIRNNGLDSDDESEAEDEPKEEDSPGDKTDAKKSKDEEEESSPDDIAIGAIQRVTPKQWRRKGGKPRFANDKKVAFYIEQESSAELDQAKSGTDLSSEMVKNAHEKAHDSAPKSNYAVTKLAINSKVILNMFDKVIENDSLSDDLDNIRNTLIRPFKYLLTHEEKIRDFFVHLSAYVRRREQRLEKEKLSEEAAKAEKQPSEEHKEEQELKEQKEVEVPEVKASDVDETADKDDASSSPKPLDYDANSPYASFLEDISELTTSKILFREWAWGAVVDFMDNDMKDILDLRRAIASRDLKEIEFESLWHLYKPGDTIVTRQGAASDKWRAYRVLHVTGGRRHISSQHDLEASGQPAVAQEDIEQDMTEVIMGSGSVSPFIIDCFYMDFDGHKWGPRPRTFNIRPYTGFRDITSLQAYPIDFHPNEELRQDLIARGERFAEIVRQTHKHYGGLTHPDKKLRSTQAEVHCKVVVDQASGTAHLKTGDADWKMDFNSGVIDFQTLGDRRENFFWLSCAVEGCNTCTDISNDFLVDHGRRANYVKGNELLQCCNKSELTDDHLMLLPLRVYGYALQDRKWHALYVDEVEDITSRPDDAFNDLVLEGSHKKLIQALVKNQTRDALQRASRNQSLAGPANSLNNMDLVPGKGRGLIVLLHGVPGVGKTSTAECVAAQLGSPLFPITCGDLGTDPEKVEDRLEEYFTLAQRWGCVLLLDEADVFLAKRMPGELNRNALVSVFLRVLEYYAGVLILTTNRVAEFDEAFRSRIHISLYYPPLSEKSHRSIWEKNLDRVAKSGEFDFDRTEILEFAESHWSGNKKNNQPDRQWNGRQIKNAFQTAMALANWDFHDGGLDQSYDRPYLQTKHFADVATTSAHFDDYLVAVYETNHYSLTAAEQHLRKDGFKKLKTKSLQWASQETVTPSRSRRTPGGKSSKRGQYDSQDEAEGGPEEEEEADDQQKKLEAMMQLLQSQMKNTPSKAPRSSKKSLAFDAEESE